MRKSTNDFAGLGIDLIGEDERIVLVGCNRLLITPFGTQAEPAQLLQVNPVCFGL